MTNSRVKFSYEIISQEWNSCSHLNLKLPVTFEVLFKLQGWMPGLACILGNILDASLPRRWQWCADPIAVFQTSAQGVANTTFGFYFK